jgi:hypothetical protein
MATDYVLFIHGVDIRLPDYAVPLMGLIAEKMPAANRRLEQIPIYWGDLNSMREAKLLDAYQRASAWKDLWFKDLRAGDMLRFTGDAALYLSRYVGGAIADRIWEKASPIFLSPDPDDRLHFVTHSLGSVILFDLLFSTRWDGPPSLPGYESVQNLRRAIYGIASVTQTALVGMPLGSVSTMGSPIGLFSLIDVDQTTHEVRDATGMPLASHDITPRLQIMLRALTALLAGRKLLWRNYLHPGDPIGSPLQVLLPQLIDDPGGDYLDVKDALVPSNMLDILRERFPDNILDLFGALTKGSGVSVIDSAQAHTSYWTSDEVAQGIADTIARP